MRLRFNMCNRNFLFPFLLLISFLCSSCIMLPSGHTPSSSRPIIKQAAEKYDLTFSLDYYEERSDIIGVPSFKAVREKIQTKLEETRLFRSVHYHDVNNKSAYHIAFKMRLSGPTIEASYGAALLSGYTLLLIPTWTTAAIDMSAIAIVNDQAIYGVATADLQRCFIWLPLAPAGLLYNNWFAWRIAETKLINYIIADLVAEVPSRIGDLSAVGIR